MTAGGFGESAAAENERKVVVRIGAPARSIRLGVQLCSTVPAPLMELRGSCREGTICATWTCRADIRPVVQVKFDPADVCRLSGGKWTNCPVY